MWESALFIFAKKLYDAIPPSAKLVIAGAIVAASVFTGGKIWLASHDASVRKDALSGYVKQQQLDAANAQLVAITKQLADAQELQRKNEQQRLADEQALALAKEQLDAAIKADTDPRGATWTDYDFQWLHDHGQAAGEEAK